MKLSCTNYMVPGRTLTEQALKLRQWGYDGMGVFVDYTAWGPNLEKEILDMEKNTGIVPCEFVFQDAVYGHLMDDNPEISNKARKMYQEAAVFCAKIGAVTELEYQYGAQNPLPLFDIYAKMPSGKDKEFYQVFRSITEQLEGSDGYALLEPINRYEAPYLNNADDCLDAIRQVDMKNAGLLLDTFHLSIEEKSIPDKIHAAGNLIKYVHLGDNNRQMPGYGNLPWKEIIDALKDVGYNGYLSLECSLSGDPEKTLPENVEFLKKLI